MKRKVGTIVMAVGLTALFVTVVVVLIVALMTHSEPGFLHDDRRWDHTPVGVTCALYVDGVGDCGAVRRVVQQLNARLGFDMLRYGEPAAIGVTLGVPSELGWTDPGGVAEIRWTGSRITSCDVRVVNAGTDEMRDLILEHELGHCLGLAHDDFDSSIMRRVQRPTPNGAFPPRITDHDRQLLRALYMEGP